MQKHWYKLQNIYYEDYKTGSTGKQRKANKRYHKRIEKRKLDKILGGEKWD